MILLIKKSIYTWLPLSSLSANTLYQESYARIVIYYQIINKLIVETVSKLNSKKTMMQIIHVIQIEPVFSYAFSVLAILGDT